MVGVFRKRWLWGALLAGALCSVLGLTWYARKARERSDPAAARRLGRPIPVRTALVVEEKVDQVIGATAMTVPSETAIIHLGVSATNTRHAKLIVKAVHVKEGSYVHRGQPLFDLEDEFFRSVVDHRQAARAAAESGLERTRAETAQKEKARKLALASAQAEFDFRTEDIKIRKKHVEESEALYKNKDKDPRTVTEYFDALSKAKSAAVALTRADQHLQQAKADIRLGALADREAEAKAVAAQALAASELIAARKELAECRIQTPIDGLVEGFTLLPGQSVDSRSAPAHILQVSPIFVRMDYPQERIKEVALGQQAEVVLDGFPGETFEGRVARIGARADTHLRVLQVLIQLPNPQRRIRCGVTGFARVKKSLVARVIPATAVISRAGKSMVFQVKDGRARIHEVKIGPVARTGMMTVNSGLLPGDEVVVYNNIYINTRSMNRGESYLQDNDLVDADWRKWARRD